METVYNLTLSGASEIENEVGDYFEALKMCLEHPDHEVKFYDCDHNLVGEAYCATLEVGGAWRRIIDDYESLIDYDRRKDHDIAYFSKEELKFDPDQIVESKEPFIVINGRKRFANQKIDLSKISRDLLTKHIYENYQLNKADRTEIVDIVLSIQTKEYDEFLKELEAKLSEKYTEGANSITDIFKDYLQLCLIIEPDTDTDSD